MSLFGSNNEAKWLSDFERSLYEEEYRYKKNIGEFAINVNVNLIKWISMVADSAVVEMMHNDYSKGVPPEQSARRIVDHLKKQNTDVMSTLNNSLSAALKIADTLTRRVEELERQIKESKNHS